MAATAADSLTATDVAAAAVETAVCGLSCCSSAAAVTAVDSAVDSAANL